MLFKVQSAYKTKYIECDPATFVIRNERDILDLIAVCGENETHNVLIYESNLSPDFFDLKTQLAGTVFQKFANYRMRGAGIISFNEIKSERFRELMVECDRGNLFRFLKIERLQKNG